ncbi:MAG TPA: hypothetical protein VN517_10890 [Terriglobales bacterium]|nr:hypothetical protein [Terriglobales bacterium]
MIGPANCSSCRSDTRSFDQILVAVPRAFPLQAIQSRFYVTGIHLLSLWALHALAMGQGVCRKSKLWNVKGRKEIESLALDQW